MHARSGCKKCASCGYVLEITVNLRLEEVRIVVIGKHPLRSLPQEIAVLGMDLSKWVFFVSNRIQKELGGFAPVYMAWWVLIATVNNGAIKECSLSKYLLWKK